MIFKRTKYLFLYSNNVVNKQCCRRSLILCKGKRQQTCEIALKYTKDTLHVTALISTLQLQKQGNVRLTFLSHLQFDGLTFCEGGHVEVKYKLPQHFTFVDA